jgi:hypothetical protein
MPNSGVRIKGHLASNRMNQAESNCRCWREIFIIQRAIVQTVSEACEARRKKVRLLLYSKLDGRWLMSDTSFGLAVTIKSVNVDLYEKKAIQSSRKGRFSKSEMNEFTHQLTCESNTSYKLTEVGERFAPLSSTFFLGLSIIILH